MDDDDDVVDDDSRVVAFDFGFVVVQFLPRWGRRGKLDDDDNQFGRKVR